MRKQPFTVVRSNRPVSFLLTVLLAACGAPEVQSAPESNDSAAQSQEPEGDEPLPSEKEGQFGAQAACCWVACNDGVPGYYGPYRGVRWGDCNNWGHSFCRAHGWGFKDARWGSC